MKSNHSILAVNKIKLMSVDSDEQARRIEEAIARHAYEIFERRGGTGWHELEDWRQAESEVRGKLCFSLSTADGSFHVGFNVAHFEEGTIEIWVAPLQLTISGKPIRKKEQTGGTAPSYERVVFRTIVLPAEIEPTRAVASAKCNFVEICLPLIHVAYAEESRAQAA
jgi:HSP20 family molecular chaperone IbpA